MIRKSVSIKLKNYLDKQKWKQIKLWLANDKEMGVERSTIQDFIERAIYEWAKINKIF